MYLMYSGSELDTWEGGSFVGQCDNEAWTAEVKKKLHISSSSLSVRRLLSGVNSYYV
jgi:hypothetical protein